MLQTIAIQIFLVQDCWSFLTLCSGISMSSGFRGFILSRCSGGRVFSGGCSSGPRSIWGWSAGSSGRSWPGATCFSELPSSSDKDSTLHFKFFFFFQHLYIPFTLPSSPPPSSLIIFPSSVPSIPPALFIPLPAPYLHLRLPSLTSTIYPPPPCHLLASLSLPPGSTSLKNFWEKQDNDSKLCKIIELLWGMNWKKQKKRKIRRR